MFKLFVTSLFMLLFASTALAKPKDVYPVSCVDLWAAVKDSLENQSNYGILSMNDVAQSAAFTVVGNLTAYTDRIALTPRDGGCAMKATFLQIGPDNSDWRQFQHRLARSLQKLQAAKPKSAAIVTGQQ